MPTVVLWDIDGTLVRSNGGRISISAFLRAPRQACNLADELAAEMLIGRKRGRFAAAVH